MIQAYSQTGTLVARQEQGLFRMTLRDKALGYMIVLGPLWAILYTTATGSYFPYLMTMAFGLFFIHLLGERITRKEKLYMPAYLWIWLVFTIYAIGGEMLNFEIWRRKGVIKALYENYYLQSFFAAFVIENSRFNLQYIRRIIKIMWGVLIAATMTSVIQLFDPFFLIDTTDPSFVFALTTEFAGRKFSFYTFTHQLEVGYSYLSYLCILYSIGLMYNKRSSLLMAMGALASFLNQSRWIILNYLILVFQDALLSKDMVIKGLRIAVFGAGIGLLAFFGLQAAGVEVNKFVQERLMNEENVGTRMLAFDVFFDQFPLRPIFGTGGFYYQETMDVIDGRSSQIHVGYLALFYLWGLIGGVIWVIFNIMILRDLRWVAERTRFWGSYFCWFLFFVSNMTLVALHFGFQGLLMALIFHRFFKISIEEKMRTQRIKLNT